MTGFATAAPVYLEHGWHPFPLPAGQKSPPPNGITGADGKTPTPDDIEAWCHLQPAANVGLRLDDTVIGIDIDDYGDKGGAATLAELEQAHGPLPATWSSTSRGPGATRIRFYRIPAGVIFPGVLGPGIDVIQHHHRYAVVAPSTHPDTRDRYRWYDPADVRAARPPRVDELPALPVAWVDALRWTPPEPTPLEPALSGTPIGDDDSIAEKINADHRWHDVLAADGWQHTKTAGDTSSWVRPGKDGRQGISAILHEPDGPFNVFTTSVPALQHTWAERGGGTLWSFSMFGYLAATRYHGDRSACARDYRLQANAAKWTTNTVARVTAALDNDDDEHVDHDTPAGSQPYTDLGNARLLVHAHGNDLHHAPQLGVWLRWDGHRWAEDITGDVKRRAKSVVDAMVTQIATMADSDARKKLFGHWMRSQSTSRLEAMVHEAKTEPGIPVTVAELDADPWTLNTLGGAIDLRTSKIAPQDRRQLVTKLAPVTVDPDATCPTWEWFVRWAMNGDDALVDFLQRAVGYSLTGTVGEQCLFFLHGAGANGKSTFLNVLEHLLGDYAISAEADLLLATTQERHSTGIADLVGRRLVVVQETDEGRRLAEATVKKLTGGDTIRARRMRQDNFEFRPTHKLWMAANHRPVIRGTDHAIWRRIRLIPFTAAVTPEEQDDHLLDRLVAELPGILNWALEGCRQWRELGLRPPDAVISATREYRTEQDHIGRFLDDCCTLAEGLAVRAGDLRTAYEAWCKENGENPWSAKAMAPHLVDRGCVLDRTMHARLWRHIALAGPAAEELSRRLDHGDWAKRASGENANDTSDASSVELFDHATPQNGAMTRNDASTCSPYARTHDPLNTEKASDASSRVMDPDWSPF